MARVALLSCALIALVPQVVRSQTTQPAEQTIPDTERRLEMRANQAFNRGEYATALPLLQKLADHSKGRPSHLGAIREKIRVCQKALDSLKNSPPATASPLISAPPEIPMDPETRKKHPAPKPGEILEMSIKELGNFQYDAEEGGGIPADVKRLSGSTIRVKGFMIPMDQAENVTQFALVPSLFACCFGQPPQIQHTIVVNCPPGKTVDYSPDPVVVQGKLTVEEKKDDGYVISIFEIAAQSVKVAGG